MRRLFLIALVSILLHLFGLNWLAGGLLPLRLLTPKAAIIDADLRLLPPVLPQPKPALAEAQKKVIPSATSGAVSAAAEIVAPHEYSRELAERISALSANPSLLAGLAAPGTSVEPEFDFDPNQIELTANANGSAATGANSNQRGNPGPSARPKPPPKATATAAIADTSTPIDAPPIAGFNVDAPPSVDLKYDVKALRDGRDVFGHGSLSWRTAGGNYSVSGDAGVLFFTVLTFKSEGLIDEFGLAPVLYSEKRYRKSMTNTHFNRAQDTISFSASTQAYPRSAGAQDRASVIWQLVGIGRGDRAKIFAGSQIELFVAGARDAEMWRFTVAGEERIETPNGTLDTWHLIREPRNGSFDQQIEVWLAPAQKWYPVRLRYVEKNGDFLDMRLSGLTAIDPPANVPPETQPAARSDTSGAPSESIYDH